jgi:putative phosphoesterase
MNSTNPTNIGILSDTHGLVRPEVETVLSGCDQILHAGDVGDKQVLERLERLAPVTAVRGNMDYGSWSNALPVREMVEISGIFFYLLHDLNQLDLEPSAAGIHVVVSGHTHQPQLIKQNGVTYLNPGSAGHRRFDYPVSVAVVRIENGAAIPRIIELDL